MSRSGRKIPILKIVIEEKEQFCQVTACLLIVKGFGLQKTLATVPPLTIVASASRALCVLGDSLVLSHRVIMLQ